MIHKAITVVQVSARSSNFAKTKGGKVIVNSNKPTICIHGTDSWTREELSEVINQLIERYKSRP